MNHSPENVSLLETWLANEISPDLLLIPLSDDAATEVVAHLKREADRYWSIDPNVSLEYAERIIAVGGARSDRSQEALGLMARGDALKFLGNLQEAWAMLEQAGALYQAAGHQVGWARTRIGRLWLGLRLNRVPETLVDVEDARRIFSAYGEQEMVIRLEINTAYVYTQLGDQQQALQLYESALSTAKVLGEAGQPHLGMLYMNIGFVYGALGNYLEALAYYERARSIYLTRNETRNIVTIELNIAYIAQAQGHYRLALRLLHGLLERGVAQFPLEEESVKRDLAECYLNLNRYSEARDLAQQVMDEYRNLHASYDTAKTLLHLATAEAELRNFAAAQLALDEAAPIFSSLGAITWTMTAKLWQGQIALRQGDLDTAHREAQAAASYFESQGQKIHYAAACIVIGQVAMSQGDPDSAFLRGMLALRVAQVCKVPTLRYTAYLLLGRIAENRASFARAIRCYRAAAATVNRVQRGLTITLRAGFLEDKSDAWREMIGLYLRFGQPNCAFDALEQAKSQIILGYMANREQFRWAQEEPTSRALIDELNHLRAEHQVFYSLAYHPPRELDRSEAVLPEDALAEVLKRERRMRTITEQLYLLTNASNSAHSSAIPLLSEIQSSITDHTLVIEFYNDGDYLWAFVISNQTCDAKRLPMRVDVLNQLLAQLRSNISTALRFDSPSASDKLTFLAQRILQRLYSLLLEPLNLQQYGLRRLTIVPYGALHYLPFHLLFDGTAYLIECFEVVVMPAASLVIRPELKRDRGALILSHSWDGRLAHTQTEAQIVQNLFGGTHLAEGAASRVVLQMKPTQILHIAAHGQHRPDQPDLSYLELADGQLYVDDLLQQDLSYELVTLSACETGRANVAADEELIGIGRGLLYAGAGALIVSLWHVTDSSTVTFMERLYANLRAGSSKAAALREAQLSFLKQNRQLHPALWGAFQLIGDARPLSRVS